MHPQPGVLRERDKRVVLVVLLEIHLDWDVVGDGPDDAVDPWNRR